MNILEVRNLNKSYTKNKPVLYNMNLSVESGKIVGLLGPNGCGKSTLIKLISGLLRADSGEILVGGEEIGEHTCSMISYLPERTYFNPQMKVEDLVKYFEDFYSDFDSERAYKLLGDMFLIFLNMYLGPEVPMVTSCLTF